MRRHKRRLTPPTTPTERVCISLRIPNSTQWLGAIYEALSPLAAWWSWEQNDPADLTPTEAASVVNTMLEAFSSTSRVCMIGQIVASLISDFPSPPEGYLSLNGQTVLRVDYPELYDAIDPAFRLDANTIQLPDFRGRLPSGVDRFGNNGPATLAGVVGGSRTTTLTTPNLPAHAHNYKEFTVTSVRNPATGTNYNAATASSQQPTGNAGSALPFDNMPPNVAVYWYVIAR